jgi:hypothetical protein
MRLLYFIKPHVMEDYLMSKYASVLELIGNTPVVRLSRLFPDHDVWLKLERANPGGSVKDRIALQMVLDAVARGDLKKGGTIIEPTSGNTGVGLAMVSAVLGFRMILVMPESMSVERRLLAQAYGAELVLTPAAQGMKGAVDRALALQKELPDAWVAGQFENPSNPKAHELRARWVYACSTSLKIPTRSLKRCLRFGFWYRRQCFGYFTGFETRLADREDLCCRTEGQPTSYGGARWSASHSGYRRQFCAGQS